MFYKLDSPRTATALGNSWIRGLVGGNTRIAYKVLNDDQNQYTRTLSNALDYYPYGDILREYQIESEKFKFTGKERDACPSVANEMQRRRDESGYDYFEARLYDSDFGRFLQYDPLASDLMQLDKSPYAYTCNNPINLTDPDGKRPSTNHMQAEFDQAMHQYQAITENFFSNVTSNINAASNKVAQGVNKLASSLSNFGSNLDSKMNGFSGLGFTSGIDGTEKSVREGHANGQINIDPFFGTLKGSTMTPFLTGVEAGTTAVGMIIETKEKVETMKIHSDTSAHVTILEGGEIVAEKNGKITPTDKLPKTEQSKIEKEQTQKYNEIYGQ